MPVSQKANNTGLAIAIEETPKVLPGSPVWKALEPDSYADFGAEISTVARAPITNTRQRKRGTITGLTASGGFTTDITQNNFTELMQGFCFADAHEKFKTTPLNGSVIVISAVAGSGVYSAASGLTGFRVGDLVFAEGFTNAANNGLSRVTAVTGTDLTTTASSVVETPPAGARITAVGFQFDEDDLVLTVSGGLATLTSAAKTMTQLALQVGEWIFVGGDNAANRFANGSGYMRVKSVTTTTIVCDKATDLKTADTGTDKLVQIFFGTFIKNENSSTDIIERTYQLERQLGNDGNGIQSEYLVGAYPNEVSFKIPAKNKFAADLGFVALDVEHRDGTTGIKAGTRVAALGETAYNTSSDVRRVGMSIIDESTLSPDNLFTYLEDTNIVINNGITPLDAVGVVGAFAVAYGDFMVSGSTTAYFTTVEAVSAIRANTDVTLDVILAKDNAGLIFDIPMMGVGDGKPNIEKDNAIKIPLTNDAAESPTGYTLGFSSMHYLPTVAMPA